MSIVSLVLTRNLDRQQRLLLLRIKGVMVLRRMGLLGLLLGLSCWAVKSPTCRKAHKMTNRIVEKLNNPNLIAVVTGLFLLNVVLFLLVLARK